MRYENNDLLREYLNRGAAGDYREHLKHPAFDFDATAFASTVGLVRYQHPELSDAEAEARAAFRLLTSGAPPEVVTPLPSRWYRTRAFCARYAPGAWRWAKLAWAVALLALALATVLLLSALSARSAPPPEPDPLAATNIVSAKDVARALTLQPPALLPQIAGGSVAARMQYLNGSSLWTSVSASNPLPITCISGCAGGGGGGGTSSIDETTFTPAGGYFKTSITALTSGQQGSVALTANRAFHVTPYGSGGSELFTSGNAAYIQFPATPTVTVGNASLAVTGTFWQATQPVSGTFWQATQPVSGTFWQTTQPVSIATMPTTPVTGTFWQTTQPVSCANAATCPVTASPGSGVFEVGPTASANTSANPFFNEITDGTRTAIVTAGSASPASASAALTVAASPNTTGCAGQSLANTTSVAISTSSASEVQLVAGSAGKSIYVCHFDFIATTAVTVVLQQASSGTCATLTSMTGAYPAGANGGISAGTGQGVLFTVASGDQLCLLLGSGVATAGLVTYAQVAAP